jgi:ubiquinone/menaquinone biosynthesis C-methylase UbiE
MFGNTLDYYLLRPFTHKRSRLTGQQLDQQAAVTEEFNLGKAHARLEKWNQRLKNQFPFGPGLRYLDVGCGVGDLTIALGIRSRGSVHGIDLLERNIVRAKANLQQTGIDNVQFEVADVHDWKDPNRFDVVISHEALEHIHDPCEFLHGLSQVVVDHGLAVLAFGHLFYGPIGDHMSGFFRVPIPWRGALWKKPCYGSAKSDTGLTTSLNDFRTSICPKPRC